MSEEKLEKENLSTETQVAIVRIRGRINITGRVQDTLDMLKLHRQHFCSIYPISPSVSGMLHKIKDYVTWGEIDKETLAILDDKRKTHHKFYRLSPPKGGFERKGIKKSFKVGGALGDRGQKINALIRKMV